MRKVFHNVDIIRTLLPKAKQFHREPAGTWIYFTNLTLMLSFGILFCAWVLYDTDWFEIVGGLLTLGGAFTWLAFVSKILREDRVQELQVWVERQILGQKKMLIVFSLLLVLEILIACLFLGTIQVESVQDSADRALYVYQPDSKQPEPIRLSQGGQRRVVLPTTLWSPTEYLVKVSGFPDLLIKLQPLLRTDLRTPSSFRRPVVLLRPTPFLANMLGHDAQTLVVSIITKNGQRTKLDPKLGYTGQAFWIGCDDDVQVPQVVQDAWLYKNGADQRLNSYWRRPKMLGDRRLILHPGDIVQVELLNSNGASKLNTSTTVELPETRDEFVIEEVLNVSVSHP